MFSEAQEEEAPTSYFRDYRIKANIDTLPVKYLYFAGLFASCFILLMLVIGMTGPHAHIHWTTYSFLCGNEVEVEYSENCTGTNMNATGEDGRMYLYLPALNDPEYVMKRSNYQFSLEVFPYNKYYKSTKETLKKDLEVHYMLFGTNNKSHSQKPDLEEKDGIWELIHNQTEMETLFCPKDKQRCYGFLLFLERVISYKYYSIMVEFLPSDGSQYVDNAYWRESTQAQTFNDLQVGFRLTYFFITLFAVILLVIPLRGKGLREWPFEQRGVLALGVAACCFNNPFFGLELVSNSWIFPFMDSVFQSVFVCLLFMYWFFILDNMSTTATMKPATWTLLLKAGLVVLYGILTMILASWVDMRFTVNPAIGNGSITGIATLFYLSACLFGGLVVWLVVLSVLTMPVAFSREYLKIRFVFLAVPAAIVCFSMLIGIFAQTYGPYDRSTVSFLYFYSLFNVYVWLLVFGFYPAVTHLSSGMRANVENFVNIEDISILNTNKEEAMSLNDQSAAHSLGTIH